jgi:hypothetical protein
MVSDSTGQAGSMESISHSTAKGCLRFAKQIRIGAIPIVPLKILNPGFSL